MGPCLCGDPYCPSCGDPGRAQWEGLIEIAMEPVEDADDRAAEAIEKVIGRMCEDDDLRGALEDWAERMRLRNLASIREERRSADRVDGYDRDDLGESPDY